MSRQYKKGPSSWWRPFAAPKDDGVPDEADRAMMAFKGFLTGEMFLTKKGNRGQKMDTNWARYLLQAFELDDDELVKISSESKIFDLECRVIGGDFGSPYSIGQFGFYAGSQKEVQVKFIQDRAKVLNDKSGNNYLSTGEWKEMNEKFRDLVVHIDSTMMRFANAHRGDSFAALAIYRNAFVCAQLLIDLGVDPMKTNEKDQDLFVVTFNQYSVIYDEFKEVLALKDESTKRVFTPTEERDLMQREAAVIEHLNKMKKFIITIADIVTKRLAGIERDKTLKKIADLRGTTISKEQLWNIEQEHKIIHHVQESTGIIASIDERLRQYDRIQKEYVSMAAVFNLKYKELEDAKNKKEVVAVVDAKEERLRVKREKELQRKLERERRSKERDDKMLEAKKVDMAKEAEAPKNKYEGDRDELGNMHGKGILKTVDGSRYEGTFDADDMHGKGQLKFGNGNVYEGEFVKGKMAGKGTMKYADLNKYEGDWVDSKRHGKGIFESFNGDMYMGDFENDAMTGNGFMQYSSGGSYQGEWKDGKRHGHGQYTDIHQSVYDCEWVDDLQEGERGSITYLHGNLYEGGFAEGKMHGQCKFTYALGGDGGGGGGGGTYVYEGLVKHGLIDIDGSDPIPIESWKGPNQKVGGANPISNASDTSIDENSSSFRESNSREGEEKSINRKRGKRTQANNSISNGSSSDAHLPAIGLAALKNPQGRNNNLDVRTYNSGP